MQSEDSSEKTMSGQSVENAVNPHLKSLLTFEELHCTARTQVYNLLTPSRLDVMAKYIYALQKKLGADSFWGTHVYQEHLRVWNQYVEGDNSGKYSFEAYRTSFDSLLENITRSGFDKSKGLVPVGRKNVIIDGAHRIAAALAYEFPVEIVRFNYQAPSYDYAYFRERGLNVNILDQMALQYCKLDKRVRVAVIFPVGQGKEEQVSEILEASREIVCTKRVAFTKTGRVNLIKLLYRGESWLGDGEKLTSGLLDHVENRFVGSVPVKFIFFVGADQGANRDAKEKIRNLFNLGNAPIHITDTHEQTIEVAESILNENSVHFLNNATGVVFKRFTSQFRDFQDWLRISRMDKERFCIDGSSVLSAYGLRDANDLDYLYLGEKEPVSSNPLISCHNAEASHYSINLDELILNPNNHFYFRGIKFVALHRIREMKLKRGEPKDAGDVYRIDSAKGGHGLISSMRKCFYTFPERWATMRFQSIRLIKNIIPRPLMPFARAVYRFPNWVRVTIGPRDRKMLYRGFELHYSRGTSLIEGIQGGRVYEPEVTKRLVHEMSKRKETLYIDVGANVGLMTLNVMAEVSNVEVIAFEPGPHQAKFLSRNIAANNLNSRVTVVQQALGSTPGIAKFVIHRDRHSSGDGFFDTGRAGRTETIEVPVGTLDGWWVGEGCPRVGAIKIDTEGAELWVLQGGRQLIEKCQPAVVFELHPKNIRVYPYKAEEILNYFETLKYEVQSLDGKRITVENLGEYINSSNDYVAVPCQGNLSS